jgi:hypothetical protein
MLLFHTCHLSLRVCPTCYRSDRGLVLYSTIQIDLIWHLTLSVRFTMLLEPNFVGLSRISKLWKLLRLHCLASRSFGGSFSVGNYSVSLHPSGNITDDNIIR